MKTGAICFVVGLVVGGGVVFVVNDSIEKAILALHQDVIWVKTEFQKLRDALTKK